MRDKKVLSPLITDRALLTLAYLGGISNAPVPKEDTDGDADPYNDIIQAISERKLCRADEDDHGGEEDDGSGAVSSDVNDPVVWIACGERGYLLSTCVVMMSTSRGLTYNKKLY